MASPLEKYPCAACGAQAEWNPAKQLLVCPFCGTATPFTVDAATGAIEELDLAKALRELPDEQRGWHDREAHRPVPELQGGLGVRSRARRAELRVLRLAGARRLHRDQGADPAAEPAAVQGQPRRRSASRSASWYASKWLAPGKLKSRALVDRVHGVYIPYWTFDAQAVCPWEADAGPLLLHDRNRTATEAAAPRRARCATSAGSRPPARSSISSTTSRCRARRASRTSLLKQVEPFPTDGAGALRHGVSLRVRRRALPDRAVRRGAARRRSR